VAGGFGVNPIRVRFQGVKTAVAFLPGDPNSFTRMRLFDPVDRSKPASTRFLATPILPSSLPITDGALGTAVAHLSALPFILRNVESIEHLADFPLGSRARPNSAHHSAFEGTIRTCNLGCRR